MTDFTPIKNILILQCPNGHRRALESQPDAKELPRCRTCGEPMIIQAAEQKEAHE